MEAMTAFWHVINLFVPAVALGFVAAGLAKLVWRRDLAGVGYWRLAGPAAAGAALVTVAGLLFFGRDGKMATYGGMVLAAAIVLWWQGFGPGARR